MKNLKYILILIGILIPGQILLHAEVQDSTTVIPETATIVPRNTSVATSEPDTIAEKHGIMAAGVGFHHCLTVFEMIFYTAKLEIGMFLQFF